MKILKKICSFLLCLLVFCIPCSAYATDIGSDDLSVNDELTNGERSFFCVHAGHIDYLRRSPVQIDVVVTNTVSGEVGLPCTDVMNYSLIVRIYNSDGSLDVDTTKVGAVGRNLSETWYVGGKPGQKLECILISTIHSQTYTSLPKVTYFTS